MKRMRCSRPIVPGSTACRRCATAGHAPSSTAIATTTRMARVYARPRRRLSPTRNVAADAQRIFREVEGAAYVQRVGEHDSKTSYVMIGIAVEIMVAMGVYRSTSSVAALIETISE